MEDQTSYEITPRKEETREYSANVRRPMLQIYVTDSNGHREEITDLYWFEEHGVHDWYGEGHHERYAFEVIVFDSPLPLQQPSLLVQFVTVEKQRQLMEDFASWRPRLLFSMQPQRSLEEHLIAKLEALHLTPHSVLVAHLPKDMRTEAWRASTLEWLSEQVRARVPDVLCLAVEGAVTLSQIPEAEMNAAGWYRRGEG